MEQYTGYAIIVSGSLVFLLIALAINFFVLRLSGNKTAVGRSSQAQQSPQIPLDNLVQFAMPDKNDPDLQAQMRANLEAPAVVNKNASKPVKSGNLLGSTSKTAPVYLSLSSQPRTILRAMDNLVAETRRVNAARQHWKWMPRLGFFIGIGMMAMDLILYFLGYSSCVFSIGGLAIWVASFVFSLALKRQGSSEFPNSYQNIRQIIYTLRDDLKPGSPLLGHIDLTGYKQNEKIARQTSDSMNRTTDHYRDEWLSMKAKLYDGNVLRVSAAQRVKIRKSFTKRSSISGKIKMKPEKFKGSLNELKVRIVVNPDAYIIEPKQEFAPGIAIGQYTIAQLTTEGGLINLTAHAPFDEIQPESILNVLQHAYGLLQGKAA